MAIPLLRKKETLVYFKFWKVLLLFLQDLHFFRYYVSIALWRRWESGSKQNLHDKFTCLIHHTCLVICTNNMPHWSICTIYYHFSPITYKWPLLNVDMDIFINWKCLYLFYTCVWDTHTEYLLEALLMHERLWSRWYPRLLMFLLGHHPVFSFSTNGVMSKF